jgi:transcriptional regulator of acetoin/glycerol metabolism
VGILLAAFGWIFGVIKGLIRPITDLILARSPTIGVSDLPPQIVEEPEGPPALRAARSAEDDDGPWVPMPLAEALKEPERRILLKALEANGWNRQQTADQLGINRTTLYKKMKTFGIDTHERIAG